jgi:large-conductance mechanosensitive channel
MTKVVPKKDKAPSGPTDVELLAEIRDLLKHKN